MTIACKGMTDMTFRGALSPLARYFLGLIVEYNYLEDDVGCGVLGDFPGAEPQEGHLVAARLESKRLSGHFCDEECVCGMGGME